MQLRVVILLLVFSLSFVSLAVADSMYRWEDASGKLQFGHKPPKSARNVKKLSAQKLSRYSTDKVLKNYGSRAALGSSAPELQATDNISLQPLATLTHEPVTLERDAAGQITSLMVHVLNESDHAATGISVAFEFADGSIVPATGPAKLAAQARGLYAIPAEQLPLDTPSTDDPSVRIIQERDL